MLTQFLWQHRITLKGDTLMKYAKYALFALAALSLLSAAIPAKAGNCTTNCQRTYNGGSTCQTHCY